MKKSTHLIAVSFAAIFLVSHAACKPRSVSSVSSSEVSGEQLEFAKEVIPFNRLPLERLKQDEATYRAKGWRFPSKTETVQTYKGVSYGIRVIQPEELDIFLRPGDIAVDYSPITDPRQYEIELGIANSGEKARGTGSEKPNLSEVLLIALGEQGMSHAKIVVQTGNKLCHIDSPASMSGCDWDNDYVHFFRLDIDEEKSADAAKLVSRFANEDDSRNRIQYDSLLLTDIYTKGFSSVSKIVRNAELDQTKSIPEMYCSELPFVMHSVIGGKPIFDRGYNLIEFSEQIAALKSEPAFAPYIANEAMQKSLIAFIQSASAVNESSRPMITYGVKQLLSEGTVGSSLRYLAKTFYPSVIFPKNYMIAAKDPTAFKGTRVVYIGSMETKNRKRDLTYYSTMVQDVSAEVLKHYKAKVQSWWTGKPVEPENGIGTPNISPEDSQGTDLDNELEGNTEGSSEDDDEGSEGADGSGSVE